MTLTKRVGNVISALLSILGALLIIALGADGAALVCLFLSLSLVVFGLRNLIFYWTMARHMVDGRSILYIGIIVLDVGIFSLTIARNQGLFILLFLMRVYAISGVMDLLRALEARRYQSPWRLKMAEGVINLALAAIALVFGFFLGNMEDLTAIYAFSLLYTAAVRLITAFRRTAIVYIP